MAAPSWASRKAAAVSEQKQDGSEELQNLQMTAKGHLAALLNRRWGIAIADCNEVWEVWRNVLTHDAKLRSPDCDAAAVVLLDGGDVIPLFRAAEPEIQDSESEAE